MGAKAQVPFFFFVPNHRFLILMYSFVLHSLMGSFWFGLYILVHSSCSAFNFCSGKYSVQLECCWHLYGVFRICLELKSLKKLPLISGSHSELRHELWRDAQCWSLRESPGANSSGSPATQGTLKSNCAV